MTRQTVRAAGGVLWRVHEGRVQLGLVHRPRYDDWSLPKGKLERGESELAAAVREVAEETGSDVAVSRRLTRIGYDVADTPKTVAFWLMRHTGGEFEPSDEVDELLWLAPEAAVAQLSYDVERNVLAEVRELPLPESVIVLVRHAKAGKRGEWHGDDGLRPLDSTGEAQARTLATFLTYFDPGRVVSADPLRCVQTVEPLAKRLGLNVETEAWVSDAHYQDSPLAAESALLSLAVPGRVTVVSSQGDAIPGLVRAVASHVGDATTRKSAAWALSFVDGAVVSADYYPDAGRE